jgi:hypothetical protein
VPKEVLGEGGEGSPPLPPLVTWTNVEAMANKTRIPQTIITTTGTTNMIIPARPIIARLMIVLTIGTVGPTEMIRGIHHSIQIIGGISLPSQCLASMMTLVTVKGVRGLEIILLEM